jgi:hypothetical protein
MILSEITVSIPKKKYEEELLKINEFLSYLPECRIDDKEKDEEAVLIFIKYPNDFFHVLKGFFERRGYVTMFVGMSD